MRNVKRDLANAILVKEAFFLDCIERLQNEATHADAFGELVLHGAVHEIGLEIFDPHGTPLFDSHDHIATIEKKNEGEIASCGNGKECDGKRSLYDGEWCCSADTMPLEWLFHSGKQLLAKNIRLFDIQ